MLINEALVDFRELFTAVMKKIAVCSKLPYITNFFCS